MTDIIKEVTGFDRQQVLDAVGVLQKVSHGLARNAGWWNATDQNTSKDNPLHFSNKLCLVHSEISEAMEGDRKGLMDDKLPHRQMREVELGDALIRIADLCGGYEMDLAGAVVEKLEFNAKRADHKPENRMAEGGKAY